MERDVGATAPLQQSNKQDSPNWMRDNSVLSEQVRLQTPYNADLSPQNHAHLPRSIHVPERSPSTEASSSSNAPRYEYPSINTSQPSPLGTELRLHTEVGRPESAMAKELEFGNYTAILDLHQQDVNNRGFSLPNDSLPVRTSSVKSLTASHRSVSPASVVSSPGVGPLADITPLPSPIGSNSGSWVNIPTASLPSPISSASQASPAAAAVASSPTQKRVPLGFGGNLNVDQHGSSRDATSRNRSYSNRSSNELSRPTLPRVRNIAISSSHVLAPSGDLASPLQREEHVAPQRGIAPTTAPMQSPTPPEIRQNAADGTQSREVPDSVKSLPAPSLYYEAQMIRSNDVKRWLSIRQLGVGTFSTVMLASSDPSAMKKSEEQLDPKSLVAVKICEHGPAGGADEKKIESSLKRELEILKSIQHPSLVHLRAVSVLEKRAFLVLDYSAGGDLFELASLKLEVLVPSLIRRIFYELVDAISYLHANYIVHRDIKLENVLVNPCLDTLQAMDYATHPFPIITLTDLGLGRVIPHPPESPLLTTRCGSEDYAAPELLMGQEYDGRQTDNWALGVLLYALMEGRLPFDAIPGVRRQSPTTHRIARCEWRWLRWGDTDGDWDNGTHTSESGGKDRDLFLKRGLELEGARSVVEGLLKRVSRRWTLLKVQESEWVRNATQLVDGVRREA